MNKKILLIALVIISSLTCPSWIAYGEYFDADTANVPFELELHYPENHNKSVAGYYDLSLGKGESQNLSVTIKNNQNSQMLIDIIPTDCYTHPSGGLYYDKTPNTDMVKITDKKFMWSDNISVERQIIILPNASYTLPFTITVPQVDEGEVIAALNLSTSVKSAAEPASQANSNTASFSFNIRKSITMAIKVNIKTPATLALPSIVFGDVEFEPKTCKVFYNLENILPIINNGINGDYEVLGSNNISLFKSAFNLDKMAPKTSVKVPVPWDASTLQKGDYIFKININADGTTYSFEKPFKITENDINIYSNTSRVQSVVKSISTAQFVLLIFLIAVLVIIAFLLYFIFIRKV